MAKKMSYTDPTTKVVYAESVWLPLGIYIDFSSPGGTVDFLGFGNAELAAKRLKHALGLPGGENVGPIGTKKYTLSATQVRQYALIPPAGATRLDDQSQACYDHAISVLDSDPVTKQPSTGEGAVSFFNGAVDVDLLA